MSVGAWLKVQSDLANLVSIRTFVEEAARRAGLTEEAISSLRLAVDEACANIIIHGYKDGPGELELTANQDNNKMTITISDSAPQYNPLENSLEPDLNAPLAERPPGGLGVMLIRQNSDAVEYMATTSGGNKLTLTKNFQDT